jgi:hypothetical protein
MCRFRNHTFQRLPRCIVCRDGARLAPDSALTTASAEVSWLKLLGGFSDVTRSYAGKGVLRYTW